MKKENARTVGEFVRMNMLNVMDLVNYIPDISVFRTNEAKTGGREATFETDTNAKWRIFHVDEKNSEVSITTDRPVNYLELYGILGYLNGANVIHEACAALYSNKALNVKARGMTIEDLKAACKYVSSDENRKYAFYPRDVDMDDDLQEYNGKTYVKVNSESYGGRFYTYDGGGIEKLDICNNVFREPDYNNPVFVTETYNTHFSKHMHEQIGKLLGKEYSWLASPCVVNAYSEIIHALNIVTIGCHLYEPLHYSNGHFTGDCHGFHPIVTFDAETKIYFDEEGCWKF